MHVEGCEKRRKGARETLKQWLQEQRARKHSNVALALRTPHQPPRAGQARRQVPKEYKSPVQRVRMLLQKMKDELTAEADKESEMYDKMVRSARLRSTLAPRSVCSGAFRVGVRSKTARLTQQRSHAGLTQA